MSEAKFTPGEWQATWADEFDKVHGRMHLSLAVFAPPLNPHAEDAGLEIVAYVDRQADATLMIAGRDLLAACKTVAAWLQAHTDCPAEDPATRATETHLLTMALAAIAKVEGGAA